MTDYEAIAQTLLRATGIPMSADEEERLVGSYAAFRDKINALFRIVPETTDPDLQFDPRIV